MTTNEQKIYEICRPFHYMPDWDGEFLSIEDDYKDEAVLGWFLLHPDHLDDIFPTCWNLMAIHFLVTLYSDSEEFQSLATDVMIGAERGDIFESDQFRGLESDEFEALLSNNDWDRIEQFWKHILYRYAEDELRRICQEGYDMETTMNKAIL